MTRGICLLNNESYPGMERANESCPDFASENFDLLKGGAEDENAYLETPRDFALIVQTGRPSPQRGFWQGSPARSAGVSILPIVTLPLLAGGWLGAVMPQDELWTDIEASCDGRDIVVDAEASGLCPVGERCEDGACVRD